MKTLLILSLVPLLLGVSKCASPDFPAWPEEVKLHYYFTMKGGSPNCFEYDIISHIPYKIGNLRQAELEKCSGLNGLVGTDFKSVVEYQEDAAEWAENSCQPAKENQK